MTGVQTCALPIFLVVPSMQAPPLGHEEQSAQHLLCSRPYKCIMPHPHPLTLVQTRSLAQDPVHTNPERHSMDHLHQFLHHIVVSCSCQFILISSFNFTVASSFSSHCPYTHTHTRTHHHRHHFFFVSLFALAAIPVSVVSSLSLFGVCSSVFISVPMQTILQYVPSTIVRLLARSRPMRCWVLCFA